LVCGERSSRSQFFLLKSNDKYVFMSAQGRLVFPEGGATGNSTKLKLARQANGNPAWARWNLTKTA
ncbi:MAG TPA: hypothetical protein VGI39_25020, partial [Polyangiaceae bacterium]